MTAPSSAGEPVAGRIDQDGRSKAYRPLALDARRAAFAAGLEAYARADFFEAHEILEPAWMGAADPIERELHQGLIKLAAAYVHATRGNATGVAKNLAGARDRLARAASDPTRLSIILHDLASSGVSGPAAVTARGIASLPGAIERRLATLDDLAARLDAGPTDARALLALVPPPPIDGGLAR